MGMQVHFDLRDVLRYHAVTFMSVEFEGEPHSPVPSTAASASTSPP